MQEQSIIGNLNIAPAVNWAGKNSKDYTNLFLEVKFEFVIDFPSGDLDDFPGGDLDDFPGGDFDDFPGGDLDDDW